MFYKIFKDKDSPEEHRHKVHKKSKRLIIPKKFVLMRIIVQNFFIILGSALSSFGYIVFQVPFDLAAGGITGLAIVMNQYLPVSVGMTYLILNIPLMVLGYFKLGKMKFLTSTGMAVISFYIFTDFFAIYLPASFETYPLSNDLLLNSIYAGIMFGLGMGIIYRAGGTIGGTSIPARILQQKTGVPLSQSYMITDLSIIILAGIVFSWEIAMLATLALMLAGMVSDFVMEGSSQVRTAFIITDHPKVLSKDTHGRTGQRRDHMEHKGRIFRCRQDYGLLHSKAFTGERSEILCISSRFKRISGDRHSTAGLGRSWIQPSESTENRLMDSHG